MLAKSRRRGSLEVALYIILDCGLRPVEIVGLRVERDIDWATGLIHVRKSKTRAGKRAMPMTDRVKEKLFTWIGSRTSGWLLPSLRYPERPILPSSLTKAWRSAAHKLDLPADVVLYCARHTFGTDAMTASRNPFLVQRALGHTQLSTTARYQHHELDGIAAMMNERNKERARAN